jgi:hypothetical protein
MMPQLRISWHWQHPVVVAQDAVPSTHSPSSSTEPPQSGNGPT